MRESERETEYRTEQERDQVQDRESRCMKERGGCRIHCNRGRAGEYGKGRGEEQPCRNLFFK